MTAILDERIARREVLVKHHTKQVTLLDAMLAQAEGLHEVLTLRVNGFGTVTSKWVRADLIALLTEARDYQQQQLAHTRERLEAQKER